MRKIVYIIIISLSIVSCKTKISDLGIDDGQLVESSKVDFSNFKNQKKEEFDFQSQKIDIPKKWIGVYNLKSKELEKNWKEDYSLYLNISNDSIIYEVVGYQLFQKYQLIVNEVDTETLKLSYFKTMGGIKNSLLTENTDFGTILYKKGEYTLISKYISLKNGEISNKSYPLKKVY